MQRLRTILRLQRDEFLPLRVIRQELAGGRSERDVTRPGDVRSPRRAAVAVRDPGRAVLDRRRRRGHRRGRQVGGGARRFRRDQGRGRAGTRYFDETEREIVRAVSELARYGVGGRNLRVFRSSAAGEAQLLQSILAPALRSRNPERRKEAIEALENLASVTTHLKHLLLIRDLRKIAT